MIEHLNASNLKPARQLATAILLFFAALFLASPALSQSAIRILVNDEPITSYDIQQRSRMMRVFSGGRAGEKEAIEQLIDERLMLQEAGRRNVEISDEQIEAEFAKRARGANLGTAQFEQAMRQAGFDSRTFRDFVRANLAWAQIVRARFRATVNITDQDVAAALTGKDVAGEEQTATEYMLQQILFVVPAGASASVAAQRQNEANAFRAGFQGCDHSLQQAAGTPGIVVRPQVRREEGKLNEPLKGVLAALEVGGTTEPEKLAEGFQIIAVCAKNAIAGETEAAVEVREELSSERSQLLARRYLRDLRSDAVIEYR